MATLSSAKLKALQAKYGLPEGTIMGLAEMDPTPNRAYLDWLCRESKLGRELTDTQSTLALFHSTKASKAWGRSKNICDFTAEELAQALKAQASRKLRHQIAEMSGRDRTKMLRAKGLPGAELILAEGPWKVWQVSNPDYAVILGSGTSWCTTQVETARSYLKLGHLFIIHREDKPWAQGIIGHQKLEFRTRQNNPVLISEDLLNLIELARGIPPLLSLLQSVSAEGADLGALPAGVLTKLQQVALETGRPGWIFRLLRERFWAEGWEWLLDRREVDRISELLDYTSLTSPLVQSDLFPEVIDLSNKIPVNLLEPSIQALPLAKVLPKLTDRVPLHRIKKPIAARIRQEIAGMIAGLRPDDRKQLTVLQVIISKLEGLNKTDAGALLHPLWLKHPACKFSPSQKKLMCEFPDYAEFARTRPATPLIHSGTSVLILIDDGTPQVERLRYTVMHNYMECHDGKNRKVFNSLDMSQAEITEFLADCYGYPPDSGDWQTWRHGDMEAATSVLTALASHPRCRVFVNGQEL